MDISEQKQVLKEFKQLNGEARAIFNQMKQSPDHQTRMELGKQFEAIQQRLESLNEVAITIVEENENPLAGRVTPRQAQNLWDNIRSNIRLAKFGDKGTELPEIDMAKLFHGQKSATWQEITSQVQDIINSWEPKTD